MRNRTWVSLFNRKYLYQSTSTLSPIQILYFVNFIREIYELYPIKLFHLIVRTVGLYIQENKTLLLDETVNDVTTEV
jgi:hypothetical protein